MPTVRRSIRQLAETIQDPGRVLREPEFWNEALCRRWLDHVDELVHLDRREARVAAVLGVRLALRVAKARRRRGFRSRAIVALAYAVLGSVCRAAGEHDKAHRLLSRASRLARRCNHRDVLAETLLRRAYLEAYRAQRGDGTFAPSGLDHALALADTAVAAARKPLVEARARNARAIVRLRMGERHAAAEDGRWALEALDPRKRPYDHVAALSILVSAKASGTQDERTEAANRLAEFKKAAPRRAPDLRARLSWAEALLYIPDPQSRGKAVRLLNEARRKWISLGLEAEAVAVTAELARLRPLGAVPKLCAELAAILTPGPIRDLVTELGNARRRDRAAVAERLRAAVDGPGVLPVGCLARAEALGRCG